MHRSHRSRFGSVALALPAVVGGAILFEDLLLAALGISAAGIGAYLVSTAGDLGLGDPLDWVLAQAAGGGASVAAEADKAAVAALGEAGLALPESCRWILSPDIAMERIKRLVLQDVADYKLGGAAREAVEKAFESAALSMSGRAFLTKEVIALLGDRAAHFAVLFTHELLAHIGAVAMQLGAVEAPLLTFIQMAVTDLLSGLEKCVSSVQKSWPRIIWSKLRGLIPFLKRTLKSLLPGALKSGSLVTVAAWMGAVLDDIEEQGQDGYEQISSMDWWLDLLARRAQQAAAAQNLVYGFEAESNIRLANELVPSVLIRSGTSLPGGAYRIYVDGEELPGLVLLPAMLVWDPEAVLQVEGGRFPTGEAWASARWKVGGEGFRLLRSERGIMALVPPEQAPDEPEGMLAGRGGRPLGTSPVDVVEGPAPAPGARGSSEGQATWSSMSADVDVVLVDAAGRQYTPGSVPAGSYDVWAGPYGLSRMRITAKPMRLEAGRAYAFSCTGTRCSFQ